MVVNWSAPFTLTSPLGTLALSGTTGYPFLPDQCQFGIGIRSQNDDLPQSDGVRFRPRFKQGVQMTVTLQLYDGSPSAIAIAGDLQAVYDLLVKHLDACFYGDGRLQWTDGSGSNVRMIDRIRTLELPNPSGVLPKQVVFAVESPFPYAMDLTEIDTALADGVATVINNTGSTRFIPVVEVNGPTSGFTLENDSDLDDDGNVRKIVYDSTLPGGATVLSGHHIEFDFFKKSAYLDGNGANMKPGINILSSDFWRILPGSNTIKLTGAGGTLKWQPAYL